ncbi:MAG: outer membrane lipoprotein carrier protein LolA [Bacteroidetes bacterium]|nr:outer membrane lipoprotein carrier protein LolA [Bacteroidota bacterium]
MLRHVLSLFLLASCFSEVAAQAGKGLGQNDPDAKKVLDAVSARFKTYKSVKASFTLTVENTAGKEQGSKSGTLQMKGIKYRVSLDGQDIYCDGKTIWTYDKGANEVQISLLDKSSGSITPQKLFTDFYDKDFLYKLNEEKKIAAKTMQSIELTPTDKTKPFFKVILWIDKAAKNIMSTRVYEKSGNRYVYAVGTLKTGAEIPDATFVFDPKKFPGVEVIDLR